MNTKMLGKINKNLKYLYNLIKLLNKYHSMLPKFSIFTIFLFQKQKMGKTENHIWLPINWIKINIYLKQM